MKTVSTITEEDFSFRKNQQLPKKPMFSNLVASVILTIIASCLFYSIISSYNEAISKIETTLSKEATSIQGIHKLKEDSIQLISQLSFEDGNIEKTLYNLEKNPLMSYEGYKSLVKFLAEKKQYSKVQFLAGTTVLPSLKSINYNAKTKEETAIISLPIHEIITDLNSTQTSNIVYTISLEYKLVNYKYVLVNIYETSPKF